MGKGRDGSSCRYRQLSLEDHCMGQVIIVAVVDV